MHVTELEKNEKHGCLPFFLKGIHKFYSKIYNKNAKNDTTINLLQHYTNMLKMTLDFNMLLHSMMKEN